MGWRFLLNSSLLRGLGLGLIIASLLIIGWPPARLNLNDQEIIERARQLGMVTREEAARQVENAVLEALKEKQAKMDNPVKQPPVQEPQPPKPPQAELVTVVIPPGSSSAEIADILLKAGIITNKDDFLAFVNRKKAASKFRIGTYQLKKGMVAEDLVKVLTGK